MTRYEFLEDEIERQNISILSADLSGFHLMAIYCDRTIGLSCQVKSTAEKRCILDEEFCHYLYNHGNIIKNFKQEIYARKKSYERLIPLPALKKAVEAGLNMYEIAEELEVTEEILNCAINHYRSKGYISF